MFTIGEKLGQQKRKATFTPATYNEGNKANVNQNEHAVSETLLRWREGPGSVLSDDLVCNNEGLQVHEQTSNIKP